MTGQGNWPCLHKNCWSSDYSTGKLYSHPFVWETHDPSGIGKNISKSNQLTIVYILVCCQAQNNYVCLTEYAKLLLFKVLEVLIRYVQFSHALIWCLPCHISMPHTATPFITECLDFNVYSRTKMLSSPDSLEQTCNIQVPMTKSLAMWKYHMMQHGGNIDREPIWLYMWAHLSQLFPTE